MKRILTIALPILGTFLALGLGLLLIRTQTVAIKARFGAIRGAVVDVVEEVTEEIGEVLE